MNSIMKVKLNIQLQYQQINKEIFFFLTTIKSLLYVKKKSYTDYIKSIDCRNNNSIFINKFLL